MLAQFAGSQIDNSCGRIQLPWVCVPLVNRRRQPAVGLRKTFDT
jgi:hypothetical protein